MLDFHHVQFVAAAAVVRLEVEPSAHYHDVVRFPVAAAVDVGYLPCRVVGSLVRPQFFAAAAVGRLEVEPSAHGAHGRDVEIIPAAAAAPDVGDLPC